LFFGGPILLILGVGIIIFQIYAFLRYGAWKPYPLSYLVYTIYPEYLLYPEGDWIGLKKIISTTIDLIPLSIFLIFSGFYLGPYVLKFFEEDKKITKELLEKLIEEENRDKRKDNN